MTEMTVLNPVHRALGAKMVDFGGWDMPISYGSQIEEHHAVRRDAGMFDVSHMTGDLAHGKGSGLSDGVRGRDSSKRPRWRAKRPRKPDRCAQKDT